MNSHNYYSTDEKKQASTNNKQREQNGEESVKPNSKIVQQMERFDYVKEENLKFENQNNQHFDKIPLYYDQVNESLQIAQIYQNFKQNHFDVNKQSQGFENEKTKQFEKDIRDGKSINGYNIDSTPATPSYMMFGSDYIKSSQTQGVHEKPDEYSPIQRLEDSRGDMTAQIFDLSMTQSRDNFYSQTNKNLNSQHRSTFSNFVNQANQQQNGVKSNFTSPYQSLSNIPQGQMTKLGNQKNENKSQKLRERLEKYSHQMLNNINPQKGVLDGQQKNQAKSQGIISKTLNNLVVDNKRIQAIKNSAKNSKVSSPASTLRNAQGEIKSGDLELNEQNREKQQNNFSKPTFSSQKKIEQAKTERNTPISKQTTSKGNTNQDQQKQNKQQIQPQIQQQPPQKKNSQDIVMPSNGSNHQAKFLLVSPEKNKAIQYNQHFNYNNDTRPSQFGKTNDDNEYDLYQNQQSISPTKINDNNYFKGDQNKYNSAGISHNRKYSDFMNDRISKRSHSQENLNFTRTNSLGSQQSLSKKSSTRKQSQNYESPYTQYNQNQMKLEKQNVKQQYPENFNNYYSQTNENKIQLFHQQIDECNLTNEDQKDDDIFSINIYKNQFQQNSRSKSDIFQKIDDEDEEINEIPQTYGINRSQSQHTTYTAKDESAIEKNNNSGIKRSYTSRNMMQNGDQHLDIPNKKNEILLDNIADKNSLQMKIQVKNNEQIINLHGNQENNHNLASYKVKNQNNKTSPSNKKNIQRNSYQNQKSSSGTKEIENDHQEQHTQEFDYKNKEEHLILSQQKQGEMKVYNLKQRKSDIIQGSKNSPQTDNSQKGQQKASQQSNFTTSSSNQVNLGKYHSSNINNNYYNSHEKQIQSKRQSDQIDVNKKTDSSQNKSNINVNSSNNPICLYNLTKDNINTQRNSHKNTSNNPNPSMQNNNYFNINDNGISPTKKVNGSNLQKELKSSLIQESPQKINISNNLNSLVNLENQKQHQQIIDFSQKSKQLNKNQSIHVIQSQGNQNYYTPQQYKTLNILPSNEQYSSNNSPSIINAFSSNNGNHNNIFIFNPATTTQNSNHNDNLQSTSSYQQNGQYSSKEKQQAVKVTKREQIANKEKFIRKSNDFKILSEQSIIDRCLQRKSSSNIRGSTNNADKNKMIQAKSFSGDNSQTINNILLINTSLNDYQNNQQNELKTLQNVFKIGIEIQKQNTKKQNQQTHIQPKTERSSYSESQQTYKQISQSPQTSQLQSAYKNTRKDSKNDTAQNQNDAQKLIKSQSTVLKTNPSQKGQKAVQSAINDTNVDYILKNLQQHKLSSQAIAMNQNNNVNQNNKSLSSQTQQLQQKQQKNQSNKNTLNSIVPQKEQVQRISYGKQEMNIKNQ